MADQVERIIQSVIDSLVQSSTSGGTQKLVITDNRVVGSAQSCRSCLIHIPTENTGNVYVTTANEAADSNDFKLPSGQVIPFPVDDVSDLHFYGTINGDVIYISWRD